MQESMVNLESHVRTPLSLVHSLDKLFRYSMNVKYRDAMSPLSHCLVSYDLTPDFGAKKSILLLLYSLLAGRRVPKSAEQESENQRFCSKIRRQVACDPAS